MKKESITFRAIGISSDCSTSNLSQTPFFPCSRRDSKYTILTEYVEVYVSIAPEIWN